MHTDPWRVLRIQAEFVEGFGLLAELPRAVSVFGSARTPRDSEYYAVGEQIGAALAEDPDALDADLARAPEEVARIFTTSVASVYPHYVAKVERKGRTRDELDTAIRWLTGFGEADFEGHLSAGTTVRDFFDAADLHPNAVTITGVVCGVRIADITDPLMRRIRILDKIVDELAKGQPLARVLRAEA